MEEPKQRMKEKWRMMLIRGRLGHNCQPWVDCDNCKISYPVFKLDRVFYWHIWCNGFIIEECPYCFPEDAPSGCVVPEELGPVIQNSWKPRWTGGNND